MAMHQELKYQEGSHTNTMYHAPLTQLEGPMNMSIHAFTFLFSKRPCPRVWAGFRQRALSRTTLSLLEWLSRSGHAPEAASASVDGRLHAKRRYCCKADSTAYETHALVLCM